MPVLFASSVAGRLPFVFRGIRIPYRSVKNSESVHFGIDGDFIPPGSMVNTREKVATVNKHRFLRCAVHFVEDIKNLTENKHKVLLTYEGYRIRMYSSSLHVNEGVIVYCLPAHTSVITRTLDLTVFSSFEKIRRRYFSRNKHAGPLQLLQYLWLCCDNYPRY